MINSNGEAVVCDFGFSRARHDVSRTLTMGNTSEKLRFLAPELLATLLNDSPDQPTQATDVYALGMTFLELGTLKAPFQQISSRLSEKVVDMVLAGIRPPKPESLAGLTRHHFDIIWAIMQLMWQQRPEHRLSLLRLSHLLSQDSWEDVDNAA